MGTGWRRAFCTMIPRGEREAMEAERQGEIPENASPGPVRSCVKLGIFSSISNPSTPRFNSQPVASGDVSELPQSDDNTPKLRCKTSRGKMKSTPSSPRSPFNILKTALRISKSGCGVCLQSVKSGQGMAIYTAECSHSFHFPCITQLVRKQGIMVCPVCSSTWKDVPLLSAHKKTHPFPHQNDVVEKTITTTATTPTNSTGIFQDHDKKIQSSISAVKTKPLDDAGRPYNDDEPLLSPTAGAKFNPIPETEDEDDEDAEEFQGFFVNSTPSTPTKKTPTAAVLHCRKNQGSVEVKFLPEAAVVSVGRSHETFTVALRVKAPPPPPISTDGGASSPALLSPLHRTPVDLVTVLDVSGSMTDAKLQMLKRAMRLVISSLGSSDRLSIIAFSSSPQRLLPLRRMTHQGQLLSRRIIDHLAVSPGKSVGSAMKIAAKVLEDRREKNPVSSIILLSDGQDQSSSQTGATNQRPGSVHMSSRFGHVEIPVSSFGYSQDAVADAFTKSVGGLLNVVVQDLRLQLGFSSGSAPGEISAVYSCNGRPRSLKPDSIRLGDLYAEEERELLVELRVPTSAIGSHHVMSVRCSYRDPGTGEVMHARERALLVPHPHAVRSSDPRIERLRNLFIATRAVVETRRLVERGELVGAQHLLVSARTVVAESSSASAEEYVRWLEAEQAALQWRKQCNKVRQHQQVGKVEQQQRRQMGEQHVAFVDENGEPLTPTSAWRAAEQLAKVAMMKKALNRASDLHGFENARF